MSVRRGIELVMVALGVVFLLGLGVACSGANEQARRPRSELGAVEGETSLREPSEDGRRCPRNKAYVEESFDTSGDNVADVRKVYRVEGEGEKAQKIIVCRELDLNHDGQKDIFRFYNEDGRPQRELVDTNFDGSIDSVSYFENGRLVKQELDRNRDGHADETRYFVQGQLARVDRDDNFDGDVDVWEHWDQGQLIRIGYDVNHDGVADFWNRAPPREEEIEEEGEEGAEEGSDDADEGE